MGKAVVRTVHPVSMASGTSMLIDTDMMIPSDGALTYYLNDERTRVMIIPHANIVCIEANVEDLT